MLRICSIVGARPQFVKAAPLSARILAEEGVEEVLVHTGQHYDFNMSEVFFQELGIRAPQHSLGVGSGMHGQQTGLMLREIEQVLIEECPDVVLVYGDTNSTLAGALAGAKLNIPVAHVEAGLRSFNRAMPEEINRIVADAVSDVLFTPTDAATRQLEAEGVPTSKVVQTGDLMLEVAHQATSVAKSTSTVLVDAGLESKAFYLATVHRAENTDSASKLKAIAECLMLIAEQVPVAMPLHPRTRQSLEAIGWLRPLAQSVTILKPVGFLDMVLLEMSALAILSDSGGVQKEAFFHGVPCFVLREETEWVELVEMKWNHLLPPENPRAMAEAVLSYQAPSRPEVRPYGDGQASELICIELKERYSV